ncbi:hypothetical protein ACFE04_009136 [Oxalis oulophora]
MSLDHAPSLLGTFSQQLCLHSATVLTRQPPITRHFLHSVASHHTTCALFSLLPLLDTWFTRHGLHSLGMASIHSAWPPFTRPLHHSASPHSPNLLHPAHSPAEHPDLGKCEKGVDDAPDGKCVKFCSTQWRGGVCKLFGDHHKCHCYC